MLVSEPDRKSVMSGIICLLGCAFRMMTFYDFSGTAATEEDHYLLSEVGKYQGMKAGRSEISIQSALTVNSSGVNSIKTVTVNSAHSGCENLCLAAVVVELTVKIRKNCEE